MIAGTTGTDGSRAVLASAARLAAALVLGSLVLVSARLAAALEGADAAVDDKFVDTDVERETDFAEAIAPLARPIGSVGAAE